MGKINLPEELFNVPWNADLVHQAAVSELANRRHSTAHTKGRGEVAGGGRKPWQQKGTGRARHGSIRSPIWVGGGVAHGPRKDKIYAKKINRQAKNRALLSLLSRKLRDNEIVFVDDISIERPKTKEAVLILNSLAQVAPYKGLQKKRAAAYIALPERRPAVSKSFRNIGKVYLDEVRNISPAGLLAYRYVIFAKPEETIKIINQRAKKKR